MTLAAGGSTAVGPTSGGKTYAYNNISTTPQTVAQANPMRAYITFHAPGSIDMYVFTSQVQGLNTAPTTPQDQNLSPTTSALGGCWKVVAGTSLTFGGEHQKAWGAFSASGSGQPLTVTESNIA